MTNNNIFTSFLNDLLKNRRLIFKLAKRDFKIKYARNYMGLMWAFIEPLALLIIMLLVFTYLRNRSHPEYPFIVYLLSGLIGYNFFSKGLAQATNSIRAFSFMINQIHVSSFLLPLISILSTFYTHLILLVISIFIFLINGIGFSFYWFQLLYFMFAAWILLYGISLFTSSVVLFVKDLNYIITIVMRALFFLTPIFWQISMFPEKYRVYLKLNPLYYLVEGYRMSLLYHEPFWSDRVAMISFWVFTIVILFLGSKVFSRLKSYFSDIIN